MKLNPKALGLSLGIVWGAMVMIATWILMAQGGGAQLAKLGKIYFGYSVTFLGSLIGLVWGFVDGLVAGVIAAWLYNVFAGEKGK